MSKNLKTLVETRLTAIGINPFEAARRAGFERSYVNDILNGKKKSVRGDKAEDLARALEISVSELLEAGKQTGMVQIVGLVSAGSDMITFADGQGPFGEAKAPANATPSTVGVEVRGDSLGPTFNGWTLFYDDRREPVSPDLLGRFCVVGLADGRVVAKSIKTGQLPGRYNLIANVGPPIYDAEVEWAALVINMAPAGS